VKALEQPVDNGLTLLIWKVARNVLISDIYATSRLFGFGVWSDRG
jgi:hypothetical protein